MTKSKQANNKMPSTQQIAEKLAIYNLREEEKRKSEENMLSKTAIG